MAAVKSRRVAVIGAGCSGLTAVKCCLETEGLHPVCYELTEDLGGLWNYRDATTVSDVHGDVSCVMKSTVINTSKEMMAYSDFPIPADWPNFLHNKLVMAYFRSYVEAFRLEKYIEFGHRVRRIQRAGGLGEVYGANWLLDVENVDSGEVVREYFDAVFIATGHHAKPNRPYFKGSESFKGELLHTHDYRGCGSRFDNKTVLIVGIGNSGGDVAVEISRLTKQTYVSTRRGSWIFHRIGAAGLPVDLVATRRVTELLKSVVNVNAALESSLTQRVDHELYGLKPDHAPLAAHPTMNDELPNRIASGSVVIKPNVARIDGATVHFEDGSHVDDVDTIILATGYHVTFPFMQDQLFEVCDNKVGLYKYVFPPDDETGSLAILGCIQPWGAIMPISELQSRLACQVFKKEVRLPTSYVMRADIKDKERAMARRYTKSLRHTIQVDFIPYMDELASLLGCKPRLGRLLLSDPVLWYNVVFGPTTPYQYRLHGPGAWTGARRAILSQWDRVAAPFKTRRVPPTRRRRGSVVQFSVKMIVIAAFFTILYQYIIRLS